LGSPRWGGTFAYRPGDRPTGQPIFPANKGSGLFLEDWTKKGVWAPGKGGRRIGPVKKRAGKGFRGPFRQGGPGNTTDPTGGGTRGARILGRGGGRGLYGGAGAPTPNGHSLFPRTNDLFRIVNGNGPVPGFFPRFFAFLTPLGPPFHIWLGKTGRPLSENRNPKRGLSWLRGAPFRPTKTGGGGRFLWKSLFGGDPPAPNGWATRFAFQGGTFNLFLPRGVP